MCLEDIMYQSIGLRSFNSTGKIIPGFLGLSQNPFYLYTNNIIYTRVGWQLTVCTVA